MELKDPKTSSRRQPVVYNGLMKWVFISIGILALGLGSLGIIIPGLPTTPFVLLAAYFFVRSSPRLHRRLLSHPRFGPLIEQFQSGKGLSLRVKITSLTLAYVSVGVSIAVIDLLALRVVLVLLMLTATLYMIKLPTCHTAETGDEDAEDSTEK